MTAHSVGALVIAADGEVMPFRDAGMAAGYVEAIDVRDLRHHNRGLSNSDEPRAVANELLTIGWNLRWPKRPRWRDRRLHGQDHTRAVPRRRADLSHAASLHRERPISDVPRVGASR